MIVSIFFMMCIIIVFFMCNYRNSFTKIISLYFATLSVMTVMGIIYVSRFSNYYSLMKLDYRIYLFLSSVRIPLSNIARMYNISLVLYMLDSVIFIHCLNKLNIKKIVFLLVPLLFFCTVNDPMVSKYLYLESMQPQNVHVSVFIKVCPYINRVILYLYIIMPFVSLFFYCRKTSIFVKRKDAIVSGCCIFVINIFVFCVFINGMYHIIMFDNVNMARLPNEYTMTNNIWLPVPLLAIMIFVITLTLMFRPFQVFNKLNDIESNKRIGHFNKNVSTVFHIYKNAFLGISQQYMLAETHIKSGKIEEALANIETGREITLTHMAMLNKILGSLNHIKISLKVMNLSESVKLAASNLSAASHINAKINSNCDYIEVIGDKHHLTEVFYNLLVNAAEAADKENAVIKVNIVKENDLALVSVYDNGCGISKKDIRRIFQPFFSTKSTGSGVGLNYVNNIIRQHHGEIKVKSVFGQYTEIHVALPVYKRGGREKWIK